MRPLELWLLKRLCDKYGLDYQEIDSTLTYYENKEHLESLIFPPDYGSLTVDKSGWERSLDKWEAHQEWFLQTHFLYYYIACIEAGWTISKEVGAPLPHFPHFSLVEYIEGKT